MSGELRSYHYSSCSIFLYLSAASQKVILMVEKRMLFSRTNCWRSSRLHVCQSTVKNSISAPYGWNVTQINQLWPPKLLNFFWNISSVRVYSKLSRSFRDLLSTTLFCLDTMEEAWTLMFLWTHKSLEAFTISKIVFVWAVLFIQASIEILSTIR